MALFKDIFGFSSRPEERGNPRKWPEDVTSNAIDPFAEDAHEEIVYSREFRVRSKNSAYFEGCNRFYLAGIRDKNGNVNVYEYHHNEWRDQLMLVNERLCTDPMEVVKLFCAFEAKAATKADPVDPTWQNYRAYARDHGIHFDDNNAPYVFDASQRLTKTTYLNKSHLNVFYGREAGLPPADTWQGLYARIGGRTLSGLRHNWKLLERQKEYKNLVLSLTEACRDFDKELSRMDVGSARSLKALCNVSLNVREQSSSTAISGDNLRHLAGFFVLVFRISAVAKIVRDYPDFKDGNINTDKINALETATQFLSEFINDLPQAEKDAISRIAASGVADPCRDEFLAKLAAVPQEIAASPLHGFEGKLVELRGLERTYLYQVVENSMLEQQLDNKNIADLGNELIDIEAYKRKSLAEHNRLLRRLKKLDGIELSEAISEFNVGERLGKVQGLINDEITREADLKAQIVAKRIAAEKAAREAAEKAAAEKAAKEAAEKAAAEEAAKNPPPPPKKRNWLGF